ncbi:MAG: histidine kinase [Rhodospirillaceae bacterium]|jgi:Na+/proline symporter/signal transduction histidine kinase|nr:histidine kinase [Rhodospirillaceae bacterium]
MLSGWFILLASFGYIGLLFAIAYFGDKRADAGRGIINNPYIYSLSIAVYATSWTFYGSVGRAAADGLIFITIYLGPTLMFVAWWFLLQKILRVSKANGITSIADFIASRYGKSTAIGGLVTLIAVVGVTPYISLQLKALSTSLTVLLEYPAIVMPTADVGEPVVSFTAFIVAMAMAVFAILFGTRHLDPSEHHEGVVAAVAFESIVKLIAFVAVGLFVTFGLYDGFGDLFSHAAARPEIKKLFTISPSSDYTQWVTLTILSMAAILCLPRQFHITIVENVGTDHLSKAVWMFPLYLLLINIFVLPIAVGGLLQFPSGTVDPDTFVLTLPMSTKNEGLALLAFIGGLSAATGMAIISAIALSTMICNEVLMPALLRMAWLRLNERGDLTTLVLNLRRFSCVFVMLLSYGYFVFIGESYTLVTIGLLSFAAAAQFAPAMIGGIFWKGATGQGAFAGLGLGFIVWIYTLLLPSFALSGWLPKSFITDGPLGIALLKPYEFLGLTGVDNLSHSLFWSMVVNIGAYIWVSLTTEQSAIERIQAVLFVDAEKYSGTAGRANLWQGSAGVDDLRDLLNRFVGPYRTEQAFKSHARMRGLDLEELMAVDAEFVGVAERLLAGAIGAASARVLVASVVKGDIVSLDEVLQILDETSEVIEYSHRLEQKSHELEVASDNLRNANEQLKELDRLKDDFLSTISHELRTPLTSIRSFGEILFDKPDIDISQRKQFLSVIISESERLTRLINQILDLAKMEAGSMDWEMSEVDAREAIEDALATMSSLMADKSINLDLNLPDGLPLVYADRDRLIQVVVNLLSNAVKFCSGPEPIVRIAAEADGDTLVVRVADNGPGIPDGVGEIIFEKFQQVGDTLTNKPTGTGLGLPISRQIVEHFGGKIWFEKMVGGADFRFTLPFTRNNPQQIQLAE